MATSKKSLRIYQRYFPGTPVFVAKQGKFSPLPWVLRRVQSLFQPREWQLLTYCIMRAGPEAICWQTDREIAFDLGITHKKLPPYFKALAEKGFVKTAEADGKRYVCIVNPLDALKNLIALGKVSQKVQDALEDDLEQMRLDPLAVTDRPLGLDVGAGLTREVDA